MAGFFGGLVESVLFSQGLDDHHLDQVGEHVHIADIVVVVFLREPLDLSLLSEE